MEDLKKQLIQENPFMEKTGEVYRYFNKRKVLRKYRNEKLLILVIGVQGSGKTWYCKKNFSDQEVINFDDIIAEVLQKQAFSEETNGEVNQIALKRAREQLNNKGLAIMDSGAVNALARICILNELKDSYTKALLIVLNPSFNQIVNQIKRQMDIRQRPNLWEDVSEEYAFLQIQIKENFLEMGVDEVYYV